MATALYRRYRPESFADVIGQDHVTVPLMRALRTGRVGHAYLFSGPRGCGKTTSARILARCLNCAEGPTDTPCGHCDSCRDLSRDGAGSLDVVEIDAASHGGVDDARELRERASFAPARDRFKVFIIDEAHMVTSAGFNALLKLVEEPPEHVKFIFATTEPDKVIGTIRSRTHHYPFRLIPPQILTPYLEQVCSAEGVQVGEGVLPLVVRAGGGSARDTLSVLDQLIAGSDEHGLDHATAIGLLGFTDTALLARAVDAIADRDAEGLYGAVEEVIASGQEPRRFVEDLLERLRDLVVLAAVPDRGADLLPQMPADELQQVQAQAERFAAPDLSRCGDLVHEALTSMTGATSPRLHLELLAARLVLRDDLAAAPAGSAHSPAGGAGSGGSGSGAVPTARRDAAGGAPVPGAGDASAGGESGREQMRRIAREQAEIARREREGRGAPVRPGTPPAGGGSLTEETRPRSSTPVGDSGDGWPTETQAPRPTGPETQAPRPTGPETQGPEHSSPGQTAPAQPAAAEATPNRREEGPGSQDAADDGWGPVAAPGGRGAAGRPEHDGEQRSESPTPADAPADEPGAGGVTLEEILGHWSAIVDELHEIRRPAWALVSQNAHPVAVRGDVLVLGFRTQGLVAAFHRGTTADNLADAVRRVTRHTLRIDAQVGDEGPSGGGTGGGTGGGADGGGPRRPPAPTQSGSGRSPQATAPVRSPGPGDRPQDGPGNGPADRGSGPRAAGREDSAPVGAGAPARVSGPPPGDDWPPEPDDDPYPPDPLDHPGEPVGAAASTDTPASPPAEPATGPQGDASQAGDAADETLEHPARTDEPEIADEVPRDTVPEGEPRTHGQAALRRALETGRVVRPRRVTGTPGSPGAAPADEGETPTSAPATSSEPPPVHADADWPTASLPHGEQAPAARRDDPIDDRSAPPASPVTDEHPSGPSLVRAALHSAGPGSTTGRPGPAGGATGRRGTGAASPGHTPTGGRAAAPGSEEADPTGGASRDDADADPISRRSGREVIERLLGGTVLEVITEQPGEEPRRTAR
ncbi:DNA polymerase III subunit gamma and tau [Brachybacterium sp. EF45031]|uniref:DNA polymerase III subunit gamma and tau n=1 Tax=Brachybacterium sillae TaxID=2810536 RepID=UPI00217E8228|nr:DNA polymerase III subunit gamma and tau [Brachybacterium sillae]MCS6711499.1 DNA polymerase III subunit gamma and tau [Brachybacterium sillae]